MALFQDDGIMDHDTDGDGAINLSTSQRPSASTTPNGDGPLYGQDQHDKDQVLISWLNKSYKTNKIIMWVFESSVEKKYEFI